MIRYDLNGRTDPGRVRDNNEDAFVAARIEGAPLLLLAAIDGVGGYEGGEVASAIMAQTLLSYVEGHRTDKPLDVMKRAFVEANNAICAEKAAKPDLARMACVASAVLVDLDRKMAYVAHVGDTRIYLWGPDGLRKITHDHSLVGYMEDSGDITEFQAMNHPERNVIDRCLGESVRENGQEGFIESGIYPIPEEGKLLLCSDGLTDLVNSRKIAEVLSSPLNASGKVDALVDAANEEGGKDNVTVVLLELYPDAETEAKAGGNTPPKAKKTASEADGGPSMPKGHRRWLLLLSILGILLVANLVGTALLLRKQVRMQRKLRGVLEQMSPDSVRQEPLDTLSCSPLDTLTTPHDAQ